MGRPVRCQRDRRRSIDAAVASAKTSSYRVSRAAPCCYATCFSMLYAVCYAIMTCMYWTIVLVRDTVCLYALRVVAMDILYIHFISIGNRKYDYPPSIYYK